MRHNLLSNLHAKINQDLKINALTFLPKVLRPMGQKLPFRWQKKTLLSILNSVFDEALLDGDFDFLTQRWLCIEISDLSLSWWLSYEDGQLIMAEKDNDNIADVTFSANGDDLLLIAARVQDPDTLFFQRRLSITGDTELGLEVKNLLDSLDIEQLPRKLHLIITYLAHHINQAKLMQSEQRAKINNNTNGRKECTT